MRNIILILFSLCMVTQLFSQEKVVVDTILIDGNKRTKDFIVYRELTIKPGDTLKVSSLKQLIKKNENYLMNTELFNFVDITNEIKGEKITFYVDVTEQWYFWVFPIIEFADRNPNEWWETKDFKRLDYGVHLKHENFRGRNELLSLKVITGYNSYANFTYTNPNIYKNRKLGYNIQLGYLQSHEIAVDVVNDELVQFSNNGENVIKKYEISGGISYRSNITTTHGFNILYSNYRFNDSVFIINPNFTPNQSKKTQFVSLSYSYKDDKRDFVSYPLHGYYFNISLAKEGLFADNRPVDSWRLIGNYNKYLNLIDKLYFSFGVRGVYTNDNNQPFFLNRGLGYLKNYVRGYENYVVYGNSYFLSKNVLKYELLPQKKIHLNFIPWKQFNKLYLGLYLNAFVDIAYSDGFDSWISNQNKLPNSFLIGKGIGLDVITYYELVFRFEYSFDKSNNGGFFFHIETAL